MRKKPILAKKSLLRGALLFYGNNFVKKKIKLIHDGTLSELQPPYIVLANHCSFVDVCSLIKMMYPHCGNFVASETQIVQWPKLIMHMGILPKKQFTLDMSLLSSIRYCLQHNRPVVIYPEAKLSVVGVPNIIKPSVAKLVKMFKVPLVTVCFNGSYLYRPRWAASARFVPVTAEVKVAVDGDEVKKISVDEIFQRICANLNYDDYAYQLKNGIEIDVPDLAEGLENILYKCPSCGKEFAMTAKGNTLTCASCGKSVVQNKFGQLQGGEFDKVVDWYRWQEYGVKTQLLEGTYVFDEPFAAQKLVGGKYVALGYAQIRHDSNAISVEIENGEKLYYPTGTFYTLSFDNNFVYLPTQEAVYRFHRLKDVGCTTKLNIAVEQQSLLSEKQKHQTASD